MTMTPLPSDNDVVYLPERSGSREKAHELLSSVADDLRGQKIRFDCKGSFVATGSFLDEVVRIVLVERNAASLLMVHAPEVTAERTLRSAEARHVFDRVVIVTD